MKVKHMTFNQLKRIIENDFVGDPASGYGKDYHDYKDEILARYYALVERNVDEMLEERDEADI
jgi:hypothetical protein